VRIDSSAAARSAPHPDDETLAAGGLIAKLRAADVAVTIVAITDSQGADADALHVSDIRTLGQTEALQCSGLP
jgi:LmbE family N-acetylglucosaminyl deacetylase